MPIFIDPKTGQKYQNDREDASENAKKYGFLTEDEYRKEQESGTLRSYATAAATAIPAAAARVSEAYQSVANSGVGAPVQGRKTPTAEEIIPSAFTQQAVEAREAHPYLTGAVAAIPAVAASVAAAPLAATGLAATVGTEALIGATLGSAAQAAVENKPITPSSVLWNGALGGIFSAGAYGVGKAAGFISDTAENAISALEASAQNLTKKKVISNLADDTASSFSPEAVQQVEQEITDAAEKVRKGVDSYSPNVGKNSFLQDSKLDNVIEELKISDPALAGKISALMDESPKAKFAGLSKIARENPNELLDELISNEAVWGSDAVQYHKVLGQVSSAGDDISALIEVAKRFPDEQVEKTLIKLDELIDKRAAIEIKNSLAAEASTVDMPFTEAKKYLKNSSELIAESAQSIRGNKLFDTFGELSNVSIPGSRLSAAEATLTGEQYSELFSSINALKQETESLISGLPKSASKNITAAIERIEPSSGNILSNLSLLRKELANSGIPNSSSVASSIDSILTNPAYVGKDLSDLIKVQGNLINKFDSALQKASSGDFSIASMDFNPNGAPNRSFSAGDVKKFLNAGPVESAKQLNGLRELVDSANEYANFLETNFPVSSVSADKIQQLRSYARELDSVLDFKSKFNSARVAHAAKIGNVEAGERALDAIDLLPLGWTTRLAVKGAIRATEKIAPELSAKISEQVGKRVPSPLRAFSQSMSLKDIPGRAIGESGNVSFTNSSVSALTDSLPREVDTATRAMTDKAFSKNVSQRMADQPTTAEQFQGFYSSPKQAFQEHRKNIKSLSNNPEKVIENLTKEFPNLSGMQISQIAVQTFNIIKYLNDNLPPERGISVTRPEGLPPSNVEIRTYMLKMMAAVQPSTVFDDAKRGRLRHEQLASLKHNWPDLYDNLYIGTLVGLGSGKASVLQKQRADLLFGFKSSLDPAFSDRLTRFARTRQEPQQSSGTGPLTRSRVPAMTEPGGLQALSLGATAPINQ